MIDTEQIEKDLETPYKKRKLSTRLYQWRCERPDEWIMDEFIEKAAQLEADKAELLEVVKRDSNYRLCDDCPELTKEDCIFNIDVKCYNNGKCKALKNYRLIQKMEAK